jgi:hypothetical protein
MPSMRVAEGVPSIIRNTLFVIGVIYSMHSVSRVKVFNYYLCIYFKNNIKMN